MLREQSRACVRRLTERERFDKQRDEDRKVDADRLERIETDIRAMRDLMFEAFQRARTD
jgi:hypothetical protein